MNDITCAIFIIIIFITVVTGSVMFITYSEGINACNGCNGSYLGVSFGRNYKCDNNISASYAPVRVVKIPECYDRDGFQTSCPFIGQEFNVVCTVMQPMEAGS